MCGTRPGRLFPNGPQFSILAEIYLKVPQNRILLVRNRCAAGFPDFALFGKCPRFICRKSTICKGLLSKKKSWSHGTTMGWLGGPISRGFMQIIFCYFFNVQNMPKWHIFKKVMAIGAIVSKLESSSLGQNIARPVGGR